MTNEEKKDNLIEIETSRIASKLKKFLSYPIIVEALETYKAHLADLKEDMEQWLLEASILETPHPKEKEANQNLKRLERKMDIVEELLIDLSFDGDTDFDENDIISIRKQDWIKVQEALYEKGRKEEKESQVNNSFRKEEQNEIDDFMRDYL